MILSKLLEIRQYSCGALTTFRHKSSALLHNIELLEIPLNNQTDNQPLFPKQIISKTPNDKSAGKHEWIHANKIISAVSVKITARNRADALLFSILSLRIIYILQHLWLKSMKITVFFQLRLIPLNYTERLIFYIENYHFLCYTTLLNGLADRCRIISRESSRIPLTKNRPGNLMALKNSIKTLCLKVYSYLDDNYFFLKLFDALRKN